MHRSASTSTSFTTKMAHNTPGFFPRTGFLAAVVLFLYGCPSMSPKANLRFLTDIAKTVSPGMPLSTAIQHLANDGFTCDNQLDVPDVTCTRSRQSVLPYTCIQRVNLSTDANRETVTTVNPRPIACAGL